MTSPRILQSILGTFIDMNAQNRLSIRKVTVKQLPTKALTVRYEITRNKLYFSQSVFRAWLDKNNQDSLTVIRGLIKTGIIEDSGLICLGKGTLYEGVPQLTYAVRIPFTEPHTSASAVPDV
jgi:hypothetical protein